MTLDIFTIATDPTRPELKRLQDSLANFGASITVLNKGDFYYGHCWRWIQFVNAAKNSTADLVMQIDAYDSVCLASTQSLIDGFNALGSPIVFSYEPDRYGRPEPWLGLNPGLTIANRASLLKSFSDDWLNALFPYHFNDMYQIQQMYSRDPSLCSVDISGKLFHTVSPYSNALTTNGSKLIDSATGNAPLFVHGPNQIDLTQVTTYLSTVATVQVA